MRGLWWSLLEKERGRNKKRLGERVKVTETTWLNAKGGLPLTRDSGAKKLEQPGGKEQYLSRLGRTGEVD